MVGFKSFVDKTTLSFDVGVTAIVGPNGCGKSNVSDGIRWTLGEQNPRLLRGERMDEMIFAGSAVRMPVGAAEVSLVISDVQGSLPTPFSDVQITRRLYRSGESEYLLNGTPCRLKDITDLFLDTALGRAMPYALIEQGAIGSIVDSRPADRRALIEEAAGIMNYKLKRRAALAKLDSTAQNLLRVQDILTELERQRGSLQRQARKAERYKALSDQFTRARLALRVLEYREAIQALEAAGTARRAAEERLEGCRARLATLEAGLAEARLRDAERARDLAVAQEALYRVRNALERQEGALRGELARLDDQRRHGAEAEAAHRNIAERLAVLREAQATGHHAREEALHALEAEEAGLAALTRAVRALDARIADAKGRAAEDRARAARHAAAAIERRNALSTLEERRRLVQAQAEKSRGRLAESRALRQAAEAEVRRRLEARGQADARARALRERRDAIVAEVRGLDQHLAELRGRLATCREGGAAARSRCRSLEEVEANFEGFDEGHRFLLQRKAAGEGAARGLRGPVAEGLEVSPRHERAIEALLGPDLQGIVVEDVEAAREALHLLTAEARGRATLIPVAGLRVNGPGSLADARATLAEARAQLPGPSDDSPVEGLAVDLVASRNGDQELVARLFGDALVVRDLDAALALWDRLPAPGVIATLDGDLLTPRGTITGGPASGTSPFARRRELQAIRERVLALEAEQARLAEDLRATEELLANRRGATEAVEAEARAAEAARGRLEGDVDAAHAEGLRAARQLDLFAQEVESADAELAEIAEARRIAAEEVERLDAEALALEASRAALEASLDTLVHDREQAQAQVAEGRVRLANAEAARDARRRELDRAVADLVRAEAEVAGLAQALARAADEIGALERHTEDLRAAAVALAAEARAAEASAHRAHELVAESQAAIQDLEAALMPARQALAEADSEWTHLEVRHAEVAKAVSLLAGSVQEDHGLAPEALLAQFAGETIDAAARREEVDALRAKLADMGAVNLGAIEEFQAVEDRYTFLTGQATDLRESVASLRKAIAEINRTIAGLFETTLAAVNRHFTAFWERIFGGGSAALVLLEAGEAVADGAMEAAEAEEEPGLEMILRFPGKRPGNLSLLSGGEKALAVLALLLALFKVKPTPFCLLDEVDAPLDDANTERFVTLLSELSRDTQIIVITHNKKTMEAADALYGITMEEEGISKLISIRLRDLEAQAGQQEVQAA